MSTERIEPEFPSFASDAEPARPDLGAAALLDAASAYAPLFSSAELTGFLPSAPEAGDEPSALAHRAAALHLALASGADFASDPYLSAQG